jgi:hypothetical protein
MGFTAAEVEEAIAETFPSDDRLYDEIGWDAYEQKDKKAEHLQEYLAEDFNSITDLLDWSELAYDLGKPQPITIAGIQTEIQCVEQLGGMDKGTNANVTFKVGNQYFTKEGWYQSHYGHEYDGDFYEAEPVEKVVVEYQKKHDY